jgi:quinol monooxygenase YgiN
MTKRKAHGRILRRGFLSNFSQRKELTMFTRVVELTSKPGKSKELSNAINGSALPILQKQGGFVDEILLVSNAEPDRVLALSFWKTRDDAERYHREQYKNIAESLRHLLAAEPLIRTFDMQTSSGHKIVAGRAA